MRPRLAAATAAAACLLPTLLAYHQTPAATVYNQLLALAAWGLLLVLAPPANARWRPLALPLAALGVLAVAVLLAPGGSGEWPALALLLAAAAVLVLGGRATGGEGRAGEASLADALAQGLAAGLLLTGLAGVLIGLIQVFHPAWADGQWIARSGYAGRAVGNVRQPNHLATLLLMASVGLVFLGVRRGWRWPRALPLQALLVAGVLLTASRTGLWFGLPLLFLWGLLDRQLPLAWRRLLLATPLLALLAWGGLQLWASLSGGVFGAATRLDQEGAGSPSRIAILKDGWALLMHEPWGVGFGAFNRAWTLSAFPERPIAFFDHTHNLPLQLLVELGWLWGGALLLLLLVALLQLLRGAWRAEGALAQRRRMALMLLLVVGVHSMLEYPLWYAYFLLPTALALGLGLAAERAAPAPAAPVRPLPLLAVAGALLMAGSAYAVWEYRQVVAIYAPGARSLPLAERVARGQHTLLFSRHADYAAATSLGANARALEAARRTGWQLIDARLLIAWAKSLHAVGETDKARWLVARLREFRSRDGDAFLAGCSTEPQGWMCGPPELPYSWRDF